MILYKTKNVLRCDDMHELSYKDFLFYTIRLFYKTKSILIYCEARRRIH